MLNQRHDVAVKCIQQNPNMVEVVVQRVKEVAKSSSNSNINTQPVPSLEVRVSLFIFEETFLTFSIVRI